MMEKCLYEIVWIRRDGRITRAVGNTACFGRYYRDELINTDLGKVQMTADGLKSMKYEDEDFLVMDTDAAQVVVALSQQ